MNRAARMVRQATRAALAEYRQCSPDEWLRISFDDLVVDHLSKLYYRGLFADGTVVYRWSELSRACELVRYNRLSESRRN